MLVLSRKYQERIHIGDDITVVIARIEGDKVSIGIEAPRDVPIFRHEVLERIKAEGRRKDAPAPQGENA